ncbi:efflux RND transporter periplasmic adaptor subunit [Sphingobacterium daejeonense]|uniref:efflux RND transporter periplasmic adaptor subunit n=1 Tax=Sphingobacterium daejeonense TaxID=371142 RepID=UPI0021A83615|nr:efflux RND transporter periplasmic adaptor subunit [Sphingobacterium daejeonense]MCT1532806.1 efflux RND transporter periplasmic adaptor subunit [Sphingobacterium daejeonense]
MKAFSILGLVFLLGACQATSKDSDSKKDIHSENRISVKVVQPIEQQPTYSLKLPAELHPYESVDVYAKIKGFVRRINVDVGDRVKQGQILAVLEAPEIDIQSTADRAKSQQLKANFEVSKSRYDRLKRVRNQNRGAVSDLEFEQAYGSMLRDSAALEESNFSYKKSNQMREYLVVRAPFSGVITQRNFSKGALIGDLGLPFFRLVDNNRLKLKVVVPELHAQSVSEETVAKFKVLSKPDTTFTAKLKRNSLVIDPVSRALALEFDVPNHNRELNGGDYTDVDLQLMRKSPTLYVPKTSVVNSQSGIFVLKVIDNNKIEKIPVTLGGRQDKMVEIFGDLSTSDRIVEKASEEINSNTLIQIEK